MLPSAHYTNSTTCGRSGTPTAAAGDSSHSSLPLQGNQRSAWVINGFKLLNGHQSHLKQCYRHPKQTVASTCAGDGGKEAGEEAEENDPLDDESDGGADVSHICRHQMQLTCWWNTSNRLTLPQLTTCIRPLSLHAFSLQEAKNDLWLLPS